MKTRLIACLSLAAVLAAGLSVVLINSSKDIKKVEGYSTSNLPTTIDLNDSSESTIRSYYSSLNNKSTSERQGTNLLKNLKTILKNGQKYLNYDSGNAVWQIYEISDRDWSKSPASSTTYGTYDSSTNKINNYEYGSSDDSKNNPYVHALYTNRNVNNQSKAWGDHSQKNWGINREHVWPKAEGFEKSGAGGARGDPMHLMAGNGSANNTHSNNFYGYVNTSISYKDCGSDYSYISGNLSGNSKTLGGSTTVFEPQDSDKGDIARAIFYMVARYNYLSGSDSDGINSNNPNLTLTQSLSDWSNSGYTSSTTTTGKMGILTDLLNWHHQDPVDEYEIHRNNLLYTNYTNNRNPFIDFPEWVDFIWGTAIYDGTTYCSYSSTPTGYATPSSDTINGYNSSGSSISVTGVSLNKKSTTIAVGGTEQLTATVTPTNATNKGITWSSSNPSKVAVSNGTITGIAAGSATITVTTADGGFTASCDVTVKALSSISISGEKTDFNTGDTFSFGGIVTAHYSDSSTQDVTDLCEFTGYNLKTAGEQTVTVTYGNKSTTYQITVTASGPQEGTEEESVTASSGALSGWTASGTGSAYADGSVKFDSAGDNVYKIDIFTGTVSSNMTSLEVSLEYKWNSGTGTAANNTMSVTPYINGSYGTALSISNFSSSSYETKTFSFNSGLENCTGFKITYVTKGNGNIALKSVSWVATYSSGSVEPTITSIAVKTAPTKTVYIAGEDFEPEGLVITATYSNNTTEDVPYLDNEDLFEFTPIDNLQTTDTSVTICYDEQTCTQSITVNAEAPTSISAEVKENKVFYVGETITAEDIIVTTNLGDDVTASASFSSYTFTYADAASGGAITNKTFTNGVTYNTFSCNLTARVQRKARVDAGTVTDTLTRDLIGVTKNQYTNWTGKTSQSYAVYAGNTSGGDTYTTESIQIRSNNNDSGIVSTSSGGKLKSIDVSFNSYSTVGRTINVYGKNSAYTSAAELYDNNTQGTLLGTIVYGTSTSLSITDNYTYIGLRSNNGSIYINQINITYGSDDYAENLANYIMYEDTNNQCDSKTDIAIGYFEGLSAEERTTFMTSNGYVISTARERLNAWLRNQGKIISNSNNDYIVQVNKTVLSTIINSNNMTTVIAVILSSFGVMSIGGYFLFRKKKED